MPREIDNLRAHNAALSAERNELIAASARGEETRWQAVRDREQAEQARWQTVREREQAEEARWQATRDREQAEEARWQAVRDREQAEEARWAAVRAREQAAEAQGAGAATQSSPPRDASSNNNGDSVKPGEIGAPTTGRIVKSEAEPNGDDSRVIGVSAPKISILLPNYNHGAFIKNNIEAVLAQTYPNWELVIVDDGSSDDSRETIRSFATLDRRIVPIFLPENRGVMAAVQTGLARTTGTLLYGSAADDHIANDRFFELVVAALARHPEASGVFGKARVIDKLSGESLWEMGSSPVRGFVAPQLALEAFLTGSLFVPGAAAIWKRAEIDALGGFDESLGPQTDYFVNHALPAVTGAVFIDEVFTAVRAGGDNYHRSTEEEFFRRHALVESKLRSLDLPLPPHPNWLCVWRERLVESRLAVTRQRTFFDSVRAALRGVEPWERASLPAGFVDFSSRSLAEVTQLERDLAERVSSAHRTLDAVAGTLPSENEPSASS